MNISTRSLSLGLPLRARLIKFRYGAARDQHQNLTAATSASQAPGSTNKPLQTGEPIYDFQLPPRWRRRPLDEKEIDYINSGGAY